LSVKEGSGGGLEQRGERRPVRQSEKKSWARKTSAGLGVKGEKRLSSEIWGGAIGGNVEGGTGGSSFPLGEQRKKSKKEKKKVLITLGGGCIAWMYPRVLGRGGEEGGKPRR